MNTRLIIHSNALIPPIAEWITYVQNVGWIAIVQNNVIVSRQLEWRDTLTRSR